MSLVDFKKWLCRPVEFKGQGPHLLRSVGNTLSMRVWDGGFHNVQQYATPDQPILLANTTFKGLVINYGEGGATKWENRGSETFCATPSRQGKTFSRPPF